MTCSFHVPLTEPLLNNCKQPPPEGKYEPVNPEKLKLPQFASFVHCVGFPGSGIVGSVQAENGSSPPKSQRTKETLKFVPVVNPNSPIGPTSSRLTLPLGEMSSIVRSPK